VLRASVYPLDHSDLPALLRVAREIEPERHRLAAIGSNMVEKTGTIAARDSCSGVTR
jgi:hypothetical protein